MQQIAPPIVFFKKVLGEQKKGDGTLYRLSTHCVRIQQPEGVLLFHTLTGELMLLSREEAGLLDHLPSSVPGPLAELVPHWFLRPEEADDMAMADQTRQIAGHLRKKETALTEYLIFTTTSCNARCFYCFEEGIKKAAMTEETARAAGKYIAEHCGGKPVRLVWFGGEPLLNVRAIDEISNGLRQRDVEFVSRMDSNGYLFNAALAARARDDWNLRQVQITVDGTEEIYNSRKNYVAPQGSPYRRVLNNIGSLLDAGIEVLVRLNMDGDNERDLYHLMDELATRFMGAPGFGVVLRVIVENKGIKPARYEDEERRALAKKVQALWNYLYEKNLTYNSRLNPELIKHSCWANRDNAATITPDGGLGCCESHIDKGIWGSVFTEERDDGVFREWRERRLPEDVCRTCALYPICVGLKKCAIRLAHCSPVERAEKNIELTRAIVDIYKKWKEAER